MDGIDAAGGYGALSGARTSLDASVSILKKAIDTAKSETGELLDGLPSEQSAQDAAEPARPVGNVGHHLDLRL